MRQDERQRERRMQRERQYERALHEEHAEVAQNEAERTIRRTPHAERRKKRSNISGTSEAMRQEWPAVTFASNFVTPAAVWLNQELAM